MQSHSRQPLDPTSTYQRGNRPTDEQPQGTVKSADPTTVSTGAKAAQHEYRKLPIAIALGLAIALVVGVLVGAKVVYERAARQPVAMPELHSPDGDSQACRSLIDALPDALLGMPRAQLADPAPAGAAAWSKDSMHRATLRCGVDVPAQWQDLAPVHEASGASWLRVDDPTPGSGLHTWYTVDRHPVVAVTADDAALDGQDPNQAVEDLATALESLEHKQAKRKPLPLNAIPTHAHAACRPIFEAIERDLKGDGRYRVVETTDQQMVAVAEGIEPIVVRCAVDFPHNYKPGARLTQIDGVPWFEDTTLGNGTTASTWYSLDTGIHLAVSAPQAAADVVLVPATAALREYAKPAAR